MGLRCAAGIFNERFIEDVLLSVPIKGFLKVC